MCRQFIVQQLIDNQISHNYELCLAFIDLKKAYDSVPRSNLWKFVDRHRDTWNNADNVAYIELGNELSERVEVTKDL